MRIGCLQFSPQVGDVANNISRADAVLARADQTELENLDLLVLPEMAFSGYDFKSKDQIAPVLEAKGEGISSLWARTAALKYDCTVAVGYPERRITSPSTSPRVESYNSLIVVNGEGHTVANYSKSFLYYTDETWAREGTGFFQGEIEDLGQVAMGICMDINPYRFEAPWHAFEFGFHILEVTANLVIVSMAWLTHEDGSSFCSSPQEPDMETLTYWVQRLEPVIRADLDEEIIVVFANRCGVEGQTVYAGTSAVLGIRRGEVSVYGLLGRGVKELLVVDTEQEPFAKLVNRPEEELETPLDDRLELCLSPIGQDANSINVAASSTFQTFNEVTPTDNGSREDESQQSNRIDNTSNLVSSPALEANSAVQEASTTHPMVTPSGSGPIASAELSLTPPMLGGDFESLNVDPARQTAARPMFMGNENVSPRSDRLRGLGIDGVIHGLDSPIIETPICPSPTPMSARPKLALSTGSETLPPISRKIPTSGVQVGNFFTSRDLFTPPTSPGEETAEPQSSVRYYFMPVSSALYTPDEPALQQPSAHLGRGWRPQTPLSMTKSPRPLDSRRLGPSILSREVKQECEDEGEPYVFRPTLLHGALPDRPESPKVQSYSRNNGRQCAQTEHQLQPKTDEYVACSVPAAKVPAPFVTAFPLFKSPLVSPRRAPLEEGIKDPCPSQEIISSSPEVAAGSHEGGS